MVARRPAPRPVTDADRAEILALHAQGLSRNDIRRRTNRSAATVSNTVAEAGLSFARGAMVEAATAARKADLAALRIEEAYNCLLDATRLREQITEPATIYNFGGKDNTYESREVAEPPAGDKRALASAASMLYDRSLKLCPPTADTGAEQARSMLGQLMTGLATVYQEHQAAESADEGAGDAP